jgi:outer membrane protein, multidrug efflux system
MNAIRLILPMFTLSACTHLIGPEHRLPDLPLPDRWSAGRSDQQIDPHWWHLFQDEELNRLEDLTLRTNQDLVAAMIRVDSAQADFQTSRADTLPSVTATSSADRSQSSANFTQLPGFTPPEVAQYRLKSNLSYEFDLWGKVRRSLESSQASLMATAYARDAVMLRLTGEVAQQYFNLRTLDAERALLQKTITLRKESLSIAKAKQEGGLTNESDVTRATSSLASAEADVVDILRRRELTLHTLAELCGQPASAFTLRASAGLSKSVPDVPLSSPASLLRQRPDIAESERTLAARSAEIGVALGKQLPSLKLNGSLNLESLSLANLLSTGSRSFSIGPELSIPVFNGGANRARVFKAQAKHQEAAAEYRGVILAAMKEVEDALSNQRGYRNLALNHQTNASAAARTTEVSLERYSKGLVNYLEVVDSQREELLAKRSLVQAEGNQLQSAVQLIKALGGGWGKTTL